MNNKYLWIFLYIPSCFRLIINYLILLMSLVKWQNYSFIIVSYSRNWELMKEIIFYNCIFCTLDRFSGIQNQP